MSDQAAVGRAGSLATTQDAMPSRGLRLLGTMGENENPSALVMLGRDVLRVAPGDKAGTATILAIEPGRIIVRHNGKDRSIAVSG
ncbi:MAG: hypothetical protein AAGI10_04925 [Pseudomonadota bacterium]